MRLQIISPKCPNCGKSLKLKKKVLKDGYWDIVECPACRSDVFIGNRKDGLRKEDLKPAPEKVYDEFMEGFFAPEIKAEKKRKRKEALEAIKEELEKMEEDE
jgi:DNA-directed RNA polymerase subunit RPC12/RpoP